MSAKKNRKLKKTKNLSKVGSTPKLKTKESAVLTELNRISEQKRVSMLEFPGRWGLRKNHGAVWFSFLCITWLMTYGSRPAVGIRHSAVGARHLEGGREGSK